MPGTCVPTELTEADLAVTIDSIALRRCSNCTSLAVRWAAACSSSLMRASSTASRATELATVSKPLRSELLEATLAIGTSAAALVEFAAVTGAGVVPDDAFAGRIWPLASADTPEPKATIMPPTFNIPLERRGLRGIKRFCVSDIFSVLICVPVRTIPGRVQLGCRNGPSNYQELSSNTKPANESLYRL